LIVDNHTDYRWSVFLKNKFDLKNKIFTLLNDLKISAIDAKFIFVKILEKTCLSNFHVEQVDITSCLKSNAQELPNTMVLQNKSFNTSKGGLMQNFIMEDLRIA
jgi:hypothetical protein